MSTLKFMKIAYKYQVILTKYHFLTVNGTY